MELISILKTKWQFLTWLNTQLPYDQATSFLHLHHPREMKTYVRPHKYLYTNVHRSIIHNRQK